MFGSAVPLPLGSSLSASLVVLTRSAWFVTTIPSKHRPLRGSSSRMRLIPGRLRSFPLYPSSRITLTRVQPFGLHWRRIICSWAARLTPVVACSFVETRAYPTTFMASSFYSFACMVCGIMLPPLANLRGGLHPASASGRIEGRAASEGNRTGG